MFSWSTLLWYRCYYSHRSRDSMSPVCGIFFSIGFVLINQKIFIKTNRINSLITKLLIKLFVTRCLLKFVWLSELFAPKKTWFLDLHQVNIICNADIKMLYRGDAFNHTTPFFTKIFVLYLFNILKKCVFYH